MAYVTSSGYATVGGLAPERPSILSGLADFFGSLAEDVKNAVVAPAPAVVKNGVVLGVAKKPRAGKPGKLVRATGKMTIRTPQGVATVNVRAGQVVGAKPVVPVAPVAAAVAPAPANMMAAAPIASGAPIGSTMIATVPVAPASIASLPPVGIYGGPLPTATAFSGRPAGTSATLAVTGVPIAATTELPGSTQAAQTAVLRGPYSLRLKKPGHWLRPDFMVGEGL